VQPSVVLQYDAGQTSDMKNMKQKDQSTNGRKPEKQTKEHIPYYLNALSLPVDRSVYQRNMAISSTTTKPGPAGVHSTKDDDENAIVGDTEREPVVSNEYVLVSALSSLDSIKPLETKHFSQYN
jgi:hypothetical protein